MLNAKFEYACSPDNGNHVVVLLHGFLGNLSDWQTISDKLRHYHRLSLDLPGHGGSAHQLTQGFDDTIEAIAETINEACREAHLQGDTLITLVGYSLGARLAMYLATQALHLIDCGEVTGLVVENGHFGLTTGHWAREQSDKQWAKRFTTKPMADALHDWYQQPIFASLNSEQRQSLMGKRCDNLAVSISHMLLATSLSKQPDLRQAVCSLRLGAKRKAPLMICGEHDNKFLTLARQSGIGYRSVINAGHNVHFEQPEAFAQQVDNYIKNKMDE